MHSSARPSCKRTRFIFSPVVARRRSGQFVLLARDVVAGEREERVRSQIGVPVLPRRRRGSSPSSPPPGRARASPRVTEPASACTLLQLGGIRFCFRQARYLSCTARQMRVTAPAFAPHLATLRSDGRRSEVKRAQRRLRRAI